MRRHALLLVVVLAAACREGVAPFDNSVKPDSSGRLTYNIRGDHSPTFNKAGDSIYYQAVSYPSYPTTNGLLFSVPRAGGVNAPLTPYLQLGVNSVPWFTAPVVSPDGNTLAFFEMTDVGDRDFPQVSCPFSPLGPAFDTTATNSALKQAVLRVRPLSSTSPNDQAQLVVNFPGRTFDTTRHPAGLPYVIVNIAYPFHRLFEGEGLAIFRASWSPDGTKLVFSDGLQLRLWTVGQATSTVIPNTDDGILPAWSPDGTLIAYSKPVRAGTQKITCTGNVPGAGSPAAVFDRTIYTPVDRENVLLMLIKPDGTGARSLGNGDAPAWTPDSKTVITHRNSNLVRVAIDTNVATIITNTLNAYEPAISRDGKFLTFARRNPIGAETEFILHQGYYNIWVAPF